MAHQKLLQPAGRRTARPAPGLKPFQAESDDVFLLWPGKKFGCRFARPSVQKIQSKRIGGQNVLGRFAVSMMYDDELS
eukprot:419356-Amphidinium_carterae.1